MVLSGFICLEFFIPIAIGELIAGIIGGLFLDLKKIPWLEFLSRLGLISLMFLAGFEIDIHTLHRNKFKSIVVGMTSFFFPFIKIASENPFLWAGLFIFLHGGQIHRDLSPFKSLLL